MPARAMSLLYALTGCFDAQGGNFCSRRRPRRRGEELSSAKCKAPTLGLTERPLGPARSGNVTVRDFYRAILEGKPY
jgi:anaerobic selenocysteine-containing dehydrogenase